MQDNSTGRPSLARLALFLIALSVAGILLAGAFILAAGQQASPTVCYRSADDCSKICTDMEWKTEQGGSCATACAGWEESKCPSPAVTDAALAEYAKCTGGCVHTNVVYTSPAGTQNPADNACLQKCRETYLR